jgi:3-(3-hydroxy-phenyl)propionate hydroxylase
MLAGELALAGVDVAIVEKRASQELESLRAGGLQARTIEVLDQRGLAERFLAQGKPAQVIAVARVPIDISDFPTRHNYGLALWQKYIERLLLEWVNELGVPFYRGREVENLEQDEAGVEVALSDGSSLRAQYLVGCDGGRSVVRRLAGIEFPGWDASTSYLIGEVTMSGEPAFGLRRGEKGVYGLGQHEDGKQVRVVLCEDQVGEGEPTLHDLRQALLAVYGSDFGLESATYVSRFTDMARQAAAYRNRRVLLAGDAAHVHSPVGGQGLNTGVQDAVNLGWKLAQVVAGTSPDSLLDTYHAERHPVGARVLRNTLAFTALDRGDERSEALREALAPMLRMDGPRKHYGGMLSGLDIHYDLASDTTTNDAYAANAPHPLLGRRCPDLELSTTGGVRRVFTFLHQGRAVLLELGSPLALDLAPWKSRVQHVRATYTGAWELPVLGVVAAPEAVLVRPDGYVAWVGAGTDVGLREALVKWFGEGND